MWIGLIIINQSENKASTFLFSNDLQNIVLINQGVIFYSCKEEMENVSINNNIDLIGTDEA